MLLMLWLACGVVNLALMILAANEIQPKDNISLEEVILVCLAAFASGPIWSVLILYWIMTPPR